MSSSEKSHLVKSFLFLFLNRITHQLERYTWVCRAFVRGNDCELCGNVIPRGWRDYSEGESTGCSLRIPGFDTQHS